MEHAKKVKQMLSEQYPYKTEMHAHTLPVSPCSDVYPEEMVQIYHEKGYHAIVIANHFIHELMEGLTKEEAINRFVSNFEEAKKAGEQYDINVIMGMELRFTENTNDYLIYGVDNNILSVCYDYLTKGVETFRKEVELAKSVFVQAHPFRSGMVLCNPALLDGIESFNLHPNHNSRVGLAARYADENNFAVTTIGSDFHHKNRGHEAVSALRTRKVPKDSFDLAAILKSGDYIFEAGEGTLLLP